MLNLGLCKVAENEWKTGVFLFTNVDLAPNIKCSDYLLFTAVQGKNAAYD